MSEPEHYPPPDFSSRPPNTFQLQQPPGTGNFHPGMWSWQDTPTETSWGYTNYHGATAGYGAHSLWGSYGTTASYGQSYGHQWHQGGGRGGGRPHYGMPGNYGNKKNKKEPEYSYFCDTCDRGFKNIQKYNEHMAQHVKCSVPDCNFMAHEKIVSIHWKNNHAPGTKRIKLDTPEEIAKWREERRRNYPTRVNVEKKKKMMEMREEAGGVLETAQFGRMRGRGRRRGRGRGWGNRGPQGCHQGHFYPSNGNPTEKLQTPVKLNRDGDPLSTLAGGENESDKEDAVSESRKLVVAPKQMSSALGSLLANYGSMSESEEEPETAPIQKAQELIQENQTILNTISTKSQDSTPFNVERQDYRRGRRGRGRRGRGREQATLQKRRPTLLEMLLAQDIRHERNVLLQCVRYIVRNNFFGLDNKREGNKNPICVTNGNLSEAVNTSNCHTLAEGVKEEKCSERKKSNGLDNGDKQVVTVMDQFQDLTSEKDCCTQTSCPSVDTVLTCPEKSLSENAEELHQNKNTSPNIDCKEDNKSSSYIYDDEIWENGLN